MRLSKGAMFESTTFLVIACIAIALQGLTLFLALFEPSLRYKISEPPKWPLDSDEFLKLIGAVADAKLHENSSVDVLTNGDQFYGAALEAISKAQETINLEAYIFARGEIGDRFVEALAERARAGVQVKLVIDAIGSFATTSGYLRPILDAGGRVGWYHPVSFTKLPRINHRTHRELIIIDAETGFIGGPGIADHWYKDLGKNKRWRDTMFRVEGEAVSSMQAMFNQNWLESTGELLINDYYYKFKPGHGECAVLIVDSSPTSGESSTARALFQTLMACAQNTIEITTPYFLPDAGVRAELVRAVKERGVRVSIIAPGKNADHLLTRRSSRRLYGELLEAGARIFEYKPSMLHTKSMVIDGLWSVVGSTNFDHRSFSINDEANLASCNPSLARRLQKDFQLDLQHSEEMTFARWGSRPIWERLHEGLGRILERQQ